jgi:hypothetical protein
MEKLEEISAGKKEAPAAGTGEVRTAEANVADTREGEAKGDGKAVSLREAVTAETAASPREAVTAETAVSPREAVTAETNVDRPLKASIDTEGEGAATKVYPSAPAAPKPVEAPAPAAAPEARPQGNRLRDQAARDRQAALT